MTELDIKNDKILVGVPLERFMLNNFVHNRDAILYSLHINGRGAKPSIYQVEGHRVDRNRDDIVQFFLNHEEQPDWLLMLDSDMEHPLTVGERLTRWRKPIVGGLYFHRGDHRPLVFKKGLVEKSKYFQDVQMWDYVDDPVYDFLLKHSVPLRDGAIAIDGAGDEALYECDALGTGTIVIHRSVLEKLAPTIQRPIPWFQYNDGTQSEDLQFCRYAREAGFPVYVDLSTISGHYNLVAMGQAQFRMYMDGRGMSLSSYSANDAALWLAEEFGVPSDEAFKRMSDYHPRDLAAHWTAFSTNGAESVDAFYRDAKTGELYLLDLIRWNASPSFSVLRQMLMRERGGRVLEVGAGIGSLALQLAFQGCDVTAVEPNDRLRAFLERRVTRSASVAPPNTGTVTACRSLAEVEGEFDRVVATDVMEHIHADTLPGLLKDIARHLKLNGRLFTHNNWVQQDLYPMHYNHSAQWEGWLRAAGMHALDEFWAVKVSEGALGR